MTPLQLEIIGYTAAFLGTSAALPQLIHILRTKSARDLSFLACTLVSFSQILWLWYGILISSSALIVSNIVCLCLSLGILGLKLFFSTKAQT